MKHFILVHGAWEGSWSWEDTAPLLVKQGHPVTAVDLAGSYSNDFGTLNWPLSAV